MALASIASMYAVLAAVDWWKYIDKANEAVSHPDFDATIRNPYFLVGSAIAVIAALLRGWKAFLVLYIGAMAVWAIIDKVIMKDGNGASDTTGGVVVFAGLIVAVSGVAIYFLLIKD